MSADAKCPYGKGRLFRSAAGQYDTETCFQKCADTAGCKLFSIGADPSLPAFDRGMSMLCNSNSGPDPLSGYTYYKMA